MSKKRRSAFVPRVIFGTVFVINHGCFFSVNHASTNGTGWQSERKYRREEAELAVEVLALR